MADEPNQNGNEEQKPTPGQDGGDPVVTISQEKLNSLINEKFKKGAEKANTTLLETLGVDSLDTLKELVKAKAEEEEANKTELEKAQALVADTLADKADVEAKLSRMEESNKISTLAAKHGIKEIAYFELEYAKNKDTEGFDMATFVEGLKKDKPLLFGTGGTAPRTDNSRNNPSDPTDLRSRLRGMSLKQLKEYQNAI